MFKNSKYHQLRYPNPVNALICKILRSGVRVSQIFCFTKRVSQKWVPKVLEIVDDCSSVPPPNPIQVFVSSPEIIPTVLFTDRSRHFA